MDLAQIRGKIVLACSRLSCIVPVFRQDIQSVIHCFEEAFRFFGGCPRRIILEGLKACLDLADPLCATSEDCGSAGAFMPYQNPNSRGSAQAEALKLQLIRTIFQQHASHAGMISDMSVGHLRGGGNIPAARAVQGGLLGADYEIANGRYRFKRIFTGESWNPQLQAPLAPPGLNVNVGDFLVAINGQELTAQDEVSRLLENTAGKRVTLRIATDALGTGARNITVVPVASESRNSRLTFLGNC